MSQESGQVENVATATPTILKITISEVLRLLSEGKSRKEIAEYYGKTQLEMLKMVWGHPKLKNKKSKKQYAGIELEDDTEDDVQNTVEDTTVVVDTVENTHVEEAPQMEAVGELVEEGNVPDTSDWR